MDPDRFFAWFAFGALLCWGVLGLSRAAKHYRRGLRVIVADRRRTVGELAVDLVALVCLLLWAGEIITYAWDLEWHTPPAALAIVLVSVLPAKIAGAATMIAGLIIYGVALRHLGASWRLGIDRERPAALVTHGVYGWSRHPIYTAFDLLFIGGFLVLGRLIFLLLAVVLVGVIHLTALREERFLLRAYAQEYRNYSKRVGRYFTCR